MSALKAYSVQDEEEGRVIFAANNAVARRNGGLELGGDWYSVESCRRAPEFDEYAPGPVPAQALLEHGWWLECSNCSRQIYGDDSAHWVDDEGFDHYSPYACVGKRAWCSAACLARDDANTRERKAAEVSVIEMLLSKYPEITKFTHVYAGDHPGAHWNTGRQEATFDMPGLQRGVRWRAEDPTHVWLAQSDVEEFKRLYGKKED
jgi:hypothetical protein